MAPSVPASLKKIKVFLSRAEELDRDRGNPESRVVAYNCRQYAVLSGIPLAGQDAAAKACLGELLGDLEKEKAAMSVFSRAEHWKISRKVADRVFERADAEDRAGAAGKGTAKSFYAAGTFYEILQQFYDKNGGDGSAEGNEEDETTEQREEEEQRRLYCKWKATDILNAIKEGRTPTPGGYQQKEMNEMTLPLVGSPADASSSTTGGGLPPVEEGLPSINEARPPTVPSVPSYSGQSNGAGSPSKPSNRTENGVPPPAYNGIELNLNGDPTPTVEDINERDEDSGDEDVFIPGAAKKAANDVYQSGNIGNIFVDAPAAPPPPSYSSMTPQAAIPPPAATRPLPPPPEPAPASSSTTIFSSLFGSKPPSKLSKEQMSDAVELTRFALAALQQGEGDLGRERLEQALGLWRSKPRKKSFFGMSSHPGTRKELAAAEMTYLIKLALAALQKGDGDLGRERLEEALGV